MPKLQDQRGANAARDCEVEVILGRGNEDTRLLQCYPGTKDLGSTLGAYPLGVVRLPDQITGSLVSPIESDHPFGCTLNLVHSRREVAPTILHPLEPRLAHRTAGVERGQRRKSQPCQLHCTNTFIAQTISARTDFSASQK